MSILSSHQPLSADRKYEVVCQAVGSRPPAKITWWKDNERLISYTDKVSLILRLDFTLWTDTQR